MTRGPRFLVLVEARPPRARECMTAPPPPLLRVRAWLKVGLRVFGLVCVGIEEAPPEDGKAARG